MDATSENHDLGGERACWLDEVCPSCGGMGGHRAGCEAVERADDGAASGQAGRAEAHAGVDQENERGFVPPYLLRRVRGTGPVTAPDPDARD